MIGVQSETGLVKVSVIGIGMRSHAGVAAHSFQGAGGKRHQHPRHHHLGNQDLDPDRRPYCELAVRTLHDVYGLDKL
jgi:aspartate kinase